MGLNVLVVDDSAVMRAMLIRTLRLSGVALHSVHEAQHGAAALDVLGGSWIDLALVDLNMPVMDGEALISEIRRDPLYASLPIIVVSTEGGAARIERVRPQVSAFVRKPFTPEHIRDVVRNIIGATHDDGCGAAAGGDLDF